MIFDYLKNIALALSISLLLPFTIFNGVDVFYAMISNPLEQQRLDNKPEEVQKQLKEEYNQRLDRWRFYTASFCAFVFIVIGLLLKIDFLGAGLIFGGILTLLGGVLFYWQIFAQLEKFIVLIFSLVFLVISAYFIHKQSERDS